MQQLFIYGSLCFNGIVEKLTGKIYETTPAVLYGYKRRKVKDCDYPAVVKAEGEKVNGLLIKNLDEEAIKILAFYEGDEYKLENAGVFDGEKIESAVVFVWQETIELLEDKDWNFHQFEKESLQNYLDKIIPETLEEYKKHEDEKRF